MSYTKYQEAFSTLNDKQQEAVETIFGPVLVLAGPGSGKTQILSTRIAHILASTDYSPENILCLTFTENAAKNMRVRLASIIGPEAYKVHMNTFHGFGNEIIQRYRSFAREYTEAETIDDITAYSILDAITQNFEYKHPYKPGFKAAETLRELIGDIADLKRSGLSPEKYTMIIQNNHETVKILEDTLKTHWKKIDALGQKKEEKIKKGELFEKFLEECRNICVHLPQYHFSYESLSQTLISSIEEALGTYRESGSTTSITQWRNAWTELNYHKERVLKESLKLEKQFALAEVYELYQSALQEKGYVDFADMILESIRLLETHEDIRLNLAENYQIIMLDEFQDTNEAQMRLIHLISSVDTELPNIFAVGDDDQSIYKFQGANTKNLKDFTQNYPGTQLIILEKNYRSHQEIIEISRSLLSDSQDIKNIFPQAQKKFEAQKGDGGKLERYIFQTELDEIAWICDDIGKKINSGVAPQDIAIITKKNKSLELFAKNLLSQNIPVYVSKEESIFDREEMQILCNILKLLGNLDTASIYEDGELCIHILSHPLFGIHRLTLWKLSKKIFYARGENTRSFIESLRTHDDKELQDIGHFFIELTQRARYERLEDIIDYITGANTLEYEDEYLDDRSEAEKKEPLQISLLDGTKKEYISPYYRYFFGESSKENEIRYARHLTHLKKFIDTIRSYKKQKICLGLKDALEILRLQEQYALHMPVSTLLGRESESLQCITVHKAKGLEWKHVYVPFLTTSEYQQGKFGAVTFPKNLPLQAQKDNMEDIERLVYTATTRAESHLTLSYSKVNATGKSLEVLPTLASQQEDFSEIQNRDYIHLIQSLELEKKDIVSLPYLGDEQAFLRECVEKNFSMNVSALQNFLDITSGGPQCFIQRNLLRFPQAKNISASYGSAIHKALEDFMLDYQKNGTFFQKILFDSFETSLLKEGFQEDTLKDYLKRGKEKLTELYSELSNRKYGKLQLEYNFSQNGGIYLPRGEEEAIKLTGKIDKIEINADDSIRITDYKTGKGFDDFSFRGPDYMKVKQWKYHLQLAFYDILFSLSYTFRGYSPKVYEVFFVEKDEKSNIFYNIETHIQKGERERTEKLILAVMKKIENLDFPDTSHYPQNYGGIRQFEEDLICGNI